MVKAYNYTSLLSAMLLDAWTIPCVLLLSVFFLKMRFRHLHYLGVIVSLVGMGFLIWSDMKAGKNFPGSNYVKGDIFILIGATLYGFSNVGQEYLVRQRPMYEVVGQLGFWGTIINGIQLAILERHELQNINWDGKVIGYIIGFDIAMFLMYSVSPILFRLSSATFFNLSLLTSDFYGLLFGLFLFNATVSFLSFVPPAFQFSQYFFPGWNANCLALVIPAVHRSTRSTRSLTRSSSSESSSTTSILDLSPSSAQFSTRMRRKKTSQNLKMRLSFKDVFSPVPVRSLRQ